MQDKLERAIKAELQDEIMEFAQTVATAFKEDNINIMLKYA